MRLEKTLLKDKQYKNAQGYRSRLALLEFAVKKFNLWQWTAEHYDFSSVKTVLEVGCGTGDFWNYVSPKYSFEKIYLTDFSEGMLNTARETLAHSSFLPKIHFETADVENLQYANQSFDVVLAHLMLYHPKSQEKALAEIIRVLRKNGWVGISTFSMRIQREIFAIANKIDPRFPAYAVTIEAFDERVADQMLPQYFRNIQKYQDEIVVKVPKVDLFMDLIRSHPVTQTLELQEDFFAAFQDQVEKVISNNGTFDTAYTPILYICKEPMIIGE